MFLLDSFSFFAQDKIKGENMVKVAPSLLSVDASHLKREIDRLCKAGADYLHIDVMDGVFVPNQVGSPEQVEKIKRLSPVPLDVHLMVEKPRRVIPAFIAAGADRLTIHREIDEDVRGCLMDIKAAGIKAGVSLKPKTPAITLLNLRDVLDIVLVMTVEPGWGGQPFMKEMLPKIRDVKRLMADFSADIEVDGGINAQTGPLCVAAGANVLVSGNYLLHAPDLTAALSILKGKPAK